MEKLANFRHIMQKFPENLWKLHHFWSWCLNCFPRNPKSGKLSHPHPLMRMLGHDMNKRGHWCIFCHKIPTFFPKYFGTKFLFLQRIVTEFWSKRISRNWWDNMNDLYYSEAMLLKDSNQMIIFCVKSPLLSIRSNIVIQQ